MCNILFSLREASFSSNPVKQGKNTSVTYHFQVLIDCKKKKKKKSSQLMSHGTMLAASDKSSNTGVKSKAMIGINPKAQLSYM